MSKKDISRRSFLTGSAVTLAGAAAVGVTGCASPQASTSGSGSDAGITWDYETDFVQVGTGTSFVTTFMLDNIGADYLVVEARNVYGGTMALSGCGCWVPRNHLMDEEGFVDLSIDEITQYVHECDLFKNVDDNLLPDYLVNAPVAYKYFRDTLDIHTTYSVIPDYYNNEKGEFTGRRKLNFCMPDDPSIQGTSYFGEVIQPRLDAGNFNDKILYETTAEKLISDDNGAVIGITCKTSSGTINIKANKGVLLSTGGFDWNPEMRKEFLRFPIFASNNVKENNGSGHRMCKEVGASFGNMGSVWGLPFYVQDTSFTIDQQETILGTGWDWFYWRGQANSIIVNREGRRFTNEQASYPSTYFNYFEYDIRTSIWRNLPAVQIFDSAYVANIGWPTAATEQADWISGPFNTLEEVAAHWNLDPAGLVDEVARFNAYCDAGEDTQFHRGKWPWDEWVATLRAGGSGVKDATTAVAPQNLKNSSLGPVSTPPYYAVQIVPGCCGTCGGPKINPDAQILNDLGEPIPGLYGTGNLVAAVFGSGYPGSGGTEGPGCYYAFRAVNHAYELDLTKPV